MTDGSSRPQPGTTHSYTQNEYPRTRICVYCGSNAGSSPLHTEAARGLAIAMAANDIDLVYGGDNVGLMGVLAKTLSDLKGRDSVHGIIPKAFIKSNSKVLYGRITVVKDMHARKQLMTEQIITGGPGSGFIGLSGGYGTVEEIFETITWNQLGIHNMGICLLNIDGYWDGILQWLEKAVEQGFVKHAHRNIFAVASDAGEAIKALREYKASTERHSLQWDKT